jgi:hypothetical protein
MTKAISARRSWPRRGLELLFLATLGVTTSVWAFDGLVIEEETGQPIPGAIVVVRWNATESNLLTDSHEVCLHVETATTDALGKYHVNGWAGEWSPANWFKSDRFQSFSVYKFGFSDKKPPNRKTILLKKFSGSTEAFFGSLGSYGCRTDASQKNLYRVYAAMAADAAANADTALLRQKAIFLSDQAEDLLVNRSKPARTNQTGHYENVDPNDSYKREDLLK